MVWGMLKRIFSGGDAEPIFGAASASDLNRATRHFDQGKALLESSSSPTDAILEEAILEFERSLDLAPQFPMAHFYKGRCLQLQGDFETALKQFDNTIELESSYFTPFIDRGVTHATLGNYDAAIEDLTSALKIDGKNERALMNRAGIYSEMGELEEAIRDFTSLIDYGSANEQVYQLRGTAHLRLEYWKEASEDFSKFLTSGVDLSPTEYAQVISNLGTAYYGLGMLPEAKDNLDAAIQLDPELAEPYRNRGQTQFMMAQQAATAEDAETAAQHLAGAIQDLTTAIQTDDSDAAAFNNRANCYALMGDHQEAIEDYTRGLERDKGDAVAFMNRGMSYVCLNSLDEARQDFAEAIALGYDMKDILAQASTVYGASFSLE